MAPASTRHWAEALEPRLLHSADLSLLLLSAGAAPAAELQALLDSTAHSTSTSPTAAASEIVFIDATLPDADTLLADLQAQAAAGRPLEVVLLHSGEDGLAVIGRMLEGRGGLAAIHLIGHGADGQLQLGATLLDGQTVLQRAGELAAWQGVLAPDADLLIYGCDVAAGSAGRALVADLAALTGADVAASSDLTGAAAAGGDWVLEVRSGTIEAPLAPSAAAQEVYAGTLAKVQLEKTESAQTSGVASDLRWQHDVNNNNDRLLVVQLVIGTQAGTTSVSYGGQALTLLAHESTALGTLRTEVWYLVAPAAGRADVVVSSSLAANLLGGSMDFKDVNQASPFGQIARSSGSGSSVSLTLAAATDDLVLDLVGSQSVEDSSYGNNQNKTWEQTQGTGVLALWGSASREDGAASVTMSQTLDYSSGSGRWAAIAVALKKTSSNAAPVITSNGGGATAAVSVAENSSAVTTVAATDPENGTLTYSIAGGADAARFAIDAASGALRFVAAPNAEVRADTNADNVYEVTVSASDGLLADSQSLAVTVTDINEFAIAAVSDNDAAANQVLESAAVGSSTGITARASDADAGNNTVSYSLTDTASGRFGIDAATGIVRVAGALDREAAASHTIVVRAASSDGSSSTRSFTITLLDSDEFDTGAVTDSNASANGVDETAGIGSVVGITAQANDADATQNIVTYSLDDSAGGRFAIDASSGVLRVAGTLDYETAASHAVVVRATSADGSASTNTFTVAVNNISEAGVGTIADVDAAVNLVAENLAPGASTGLTARASDPDGDPVTYSLLDDAGGRFAIDVLTGVVTSGSTPLDAEAGNGWDIVVQAASLGGSTQQTFTIGVADIDEFDVGAPLDNDGAANAVDEDAAIGSSVGLQAAASDADSTGNTVSYSLSDDAGGRFAIDASSGRVSVAAALDRETAASHDITVRALSADGSSASTSFTIAIGDVNEVFVAAISDSDASANAVEESAAVGTLVGITAHAVDADASHNTIGYSLLDDAGGRFAIDAASGVVRVAGGLDFETATSHRITVLALSADGSSTSTAYTIDISPANDNTPVFMSGAAPLVSENTTTVTTVLAGDADLPAPSLVYSISGGADAALFNIDAATGTLRFADAPDFEAPLDFDRDNRYQLEVTASDGSRSAAQALVVTVADDNETPRLASHGGASSVAVVSAEGDTTITAVAATDPEGSALSYRISGGADSALFAVDTTTGALRWLNPPDFEQPSDSGADNIYDVTVAASDGVNETLQVFSVSVANRNEAPLAAQQLADRSASEDTPFTLALASGTFSDVDAGDTLAWSASLAAGAALPSWLTFDAATRTFSGTPGNADVGSLTLRVQATDTAGASVWQDFALTVANSNDAPAAVSPLVDQAVTEDVASTFALPTSAFADIDAGDTLTLSAAQASGAALPSWLVFDAITRTFSGTPGNADVGTLTLRVQATDTAGASAFADFTIAVANSNDAPTAGLPLADQSAAEDGSFSLVLPAGCFADVDAGDVLVLHATQRSGAALPPWLVFDAATRSFSGTPANADVGSVALRVHASDAAGAAGAWQDFVLTIVGTNDAPLAGETLAAQSVEEGERFEYALPTGALVDIDGDDRLLFTARLASGQPLPAWLSFDAEHQVFGGTPLAADRATLVVRITATDASGAQAFTDLTIAVQAAPAQAEVQAPVQAGVQAQAVVAVPAAVAPPAPQPATPDAEPLPEAPRNDAAPAAQAPVTPQPMTEHALDMLAPVLPLVADAPANAAPTTPIAATQRSSGHGSAADAVLAPAVLPQFATLGASGNALSAWLHGSDLQRNHEAMQQKLQEAAAQRRAAMASGVAISGGLSIGYVVWLVRGGVLMSSMLSTLPAWKMLDPLPVLAAASVVKARGRKDADTDDVERLFDEGTSQAAPQRRQPQAAAADKTPEEIEG